MTRQGDASGEPVATVVWAGEKTAVRGRTVRGSSSAGGAAAPAVHEFAGIRYARLRQGRRFGLPQQAAGQVRGSDTGGAPALREVPVFPQLPSRLTAAMGRGGDLNPQDDDAFFLNVWAPEGAADLPVMVFVHGGAWTTGGGSLPWYSGEVLAGHGAVVVTLNYRLGPSGHLVSGPQGEDLPFEDLICALHWVHENISGFGGDPDRTAVVGQSAGGWYSHALSISPRTRGLFRRAAHLSMGTRRPWTRQRQAQVQVQVTTELEAELGQTADPAAVPAQQLLQAGSRAVAPEGRPLGHSPSAWLPTTSQSLPEGILDPAASARAVHVEAVHLRSTAQETGTFFFASEPELRASEDQVAQVLSGWDPADVPEGIDGLSPYEKLVAASSWAQFQRLPAEYAQALQSLSEAGEPGPAVSTELFEVCSSIPRMGSGHCLDLPFQFGVYAAWSDAPMLAGFGREEFEAISSRLRAGLMEFVGAG